MYAEKDTLRTELTESKRSLTELRVRYTVNLMVKLMTDTATVRGKLEAGR